MLTVSGSAVRATIAAHMLGPASPEWLGAVRLHTHQHDAVSRLRRMMDERGGALLADDVGLGKTYVALALAAGATAAIVIAPAAVREHWLESARRAQVPIAFHSMEALSRCGTPAYQPDLVVIDEAHHFRSRHTRRFIAAARLSARARVLLLSATPVQNRGADLRALLSLFLGARADSLRDGELSRHVLRRTAADLQADDLTIPRLEAPEWLPRVDDSDCLDRILALPPAVPPIDGADGGVLVTYTLVRQWASSRGALVAALRRRLARGSAMADALRVGRHPTNDELISWCHVENAQQLAFPELISADAHGNAATLLCRVEQHLSAVRELIGWLGSVPNPDVHRARELTALLHRHSGERIVAFSEYATTISTLFRLVAPTTRAAMLTHRGGQLVSGPVSRSEILGRFASGAAARAHPRERIDMLLSTDVLSEGVNLPDASVVVHLDLAWNPARLDQRVGRLRRVDSMHRRIRIFLMPPPAPAERLLQVERRLRVKRAAAMRTMGVACAILPGLEDALATTNPLQLSERLAAILGSWRGPVTGAGAPVAAAVRSPRRGVIACARVDGQLRMFAITDSRVTDDDDLLEGLCAAAEGDDVAVPDRVTQAARDTLHRHLLGRGVSSVVDPSTMHVARFRRTILRRLDSIARRTTRERRPRLAPLVRAARAAATTPLPAGAELMLAQLACAPMADDAWLQAVQEFAAVYARKHPGARAEILALLILQPR